jgi:Protein of unknown function (DUF3341)
MYLIAEFREKEAIASAIQRLKEMGITGADLDVFSEEPVEFHRGVLDRPSNMSVVAVLGAILSGSLATSFVYFAQHNYQLNTGGMPVFSFWGTGVITYETTMLGAVLATFAWFLWESGLLRKRDTSKPVPLVPPGSMCLRVRCGQEQVERAGDIIKRTGALGVERKAES